MFNVGIIGLGHVASHQISAIYESDNFILVAGCDLDRTRFSLLDHSINTYDNIDAMLQLSELDVVVVATPNRLHAPHGIQVMAAGKWLVVEKPLAETQEDFDEFMLKRQEYAGHCTLALHAAFGVEVEWFCGERKNGKFDSAELASFAAQFYDPYFDSGQLQQRALSLGGAWMDSGINALSIICKVINPDSLVICDSRMTRVKDSGCMEVQGTVDFQFSQKLVCGTGFIDTDWTIGRDKKLTTLSVSRTDQKIILDHSAQQVILREQEQEQDQLLFSCNNGLHRLTNHYIGVFRDLAQQMNAGKDNFDYCKELHQLLYQAENWES